MLRMLLLLLLTVGAFTFVDIRLTLSANRARVADRMTGMGQLLSAPTFPLTEPVLADMHALSGAEFIVTADDQSVVAATSGAPTLNDFSRRSEMTEVTLDNRPFWYGQYESANRDLSLQTIHVFLPRPGSWQLWWQAGRAPLLSALLVLPIALLVSLALASQVTRPLTRLKSQVQQIADGNHQTIPLPSKQDEIRDLAIGVNELDEHLQQHERQLVQNERLRTMIQFGQGLAHQLRNAATGCQMALDLMALEDSFNQERYDVATRQLGLINATIRKFMLLSEPATEAQPNTLLDLKAILEEAVFLLKPTADHLGVELIWAASGTPTAVGRKDDAEQLMVNLVSNAITAASEHATRTGEQGKVCIALQTQGEQVKLIVTDNGPGPPAEIKDQLFAPFVTGSREGVGLGLYLVREIAERTAGRVDWSRTPDQNTQFVFEFGTGASPSPNSNPHDAPHPTAAAERASNDKPQTP